MTDDIDSIDGYLRDFRVFDEEAQMERNGLRLDLTASDIANARTSAVVNVLSNAGRSATVSSRAPRNEKQRKLMPSQEMGLQTEHVLEIAVVSHMINNPKFVAKIEAALGPNNMSLNNFNPITTLAQLASTLKQNPNLVGKVPKWFNDLKGAFFQGSE